MTSIVKPIPHYSPEVPTGDNSFSIETDDGYIMVTGVKGRNDAVNLVRARGIKVLSITKVEE